MPQSASAPRSTRRRRPTRPCTVKDVALAAGVSAGTVSRVTSDNPTVRPAVRARVMAAIERLGYRPNAVAQSMRTAATKLIGCIVSDISNPLYSAVLKSAEAELFAQGYTLVIGSSDERIDREVMLIDAFARRRVDGLIAVLSDERDARLVRALHDAGMPLVLMEREMELRADAIATDHVGGMRRATEHLLSLGHRRIALITGRESTRSGRDRLAGYRAAHAAAGAPVDDALVRCESLTTAFAFAETQRLLALPSLPTAIIAGGNLMLAGVLRALGILGRRVPADISVLSSGDTDLAELASPPVTVVRWDLAEYGRIAARLMLHRLQSPQDPPRRIVVPCELVLRKSCAAPRR